MDRDDRAQFVDAHWATLVQRVGNAVMPVADDLWSAGMLQWESYCKIETADTNQKRMRVLGEVLHSGGNAVKSAFYSGLEKHAPFLLKDLSSSTPTAECHVGSVDEYKKWIRREYAFVTEYNPLPGEHVLLSERYIQPLIVKRHREKRERTQELCYIGESFQKLIISQKDAENENTVLDALFSADRRGISPAAVILQANSGKGKSFTAQKIMLDWASGTETEKENRERENYDCVFHLKCKELNQISEEQSLVEILSINSNLEPDQILQILQKSAKRVLVLIDGFDELKCSLSDASNNSIPNNLSVKAPPEASLRALLQGCILPESFLLVTTRSTETETLSKLLKKPQCFTEIIGFSEKEVKEYFQKFFPDEKRFSEAYKSVKANETLFTACSIPVICWIICTVIKQNVTDCKDVTSRLETTTSIYVDFVLTLLEHHCQGLSESVPTLLKSLGQLAERGMLEQQVLFDEKNVKVLAGSPFLGKFLFKRRTSLETMYSFMHLSFQEFFTALYYVLDEKAFHFDLIKSVFPEQHFFPVVQFLYGLCNKEVSDSLKKKHNICVPPTIQAHLEKCMLKCITTEVNMSHFILRCLYELHEKDFAQKIIEALTKLDKMFSPGSRIDCCALLYCLECWPHLKKLKVMVAAEELKMLESVLCRTPELGLCVQKLADTDVSDLISALGEEKFITVLRLMGEGLSDQSVLQIFHALQKQKTVGELEITVKNITADSILEKFIQNIKNCKSISLETSTRCNDVESLCSSLGLFNSDGNLVLNVMRWCSSPQNVASLSEIILQYPRSEMSSMNLKNFLQTFHDKNCLTEESAGFDQQVDSLLSHLSSVSGLNAIHFCAQVLTQKCDFRIDFHIQSCKSIEVLGLRRSMGCDDAESLCSSLGLFNKDGNLVLNVMRWCSSTHVAPSFSEIILQFPRSEMSSMNLKNFLQAFHDINRLTEESAGFDQQVDSLFSHLSSVSGLNAIHFCAQVLTEKWASRILFLIQSCKSLDRLGFNAGSWNSDDETGLLMEEGIRLLKESPKHPQCTLNIKGFRCSKSTDACTHQTEQIEELDCNQRVTIIISGENYTEEIEDIETASDPETDHQRGIAIPSDKGYFAADKMEEDATPESPKAKSKETGGFI